MLSRENRIIAISALVTLAGLGFLSIIAIGVGLPGEWAVVAGFVFFVGSGYVAPQVYLMRVDESVGRTPRLGVIALMLILLAVMFADHVTGPEQTVLWSIVGVSVAGIFAFEALKGYRDSVDSEHTDGPL